MSACGEGAWPSKSGPEFVAEDNDAAVRGNEAQQGAAQRGFARAAFADDAQGFAAPDGEIDAIDGLDVATTLRKIPRLMGNQTLQIGDIDDGGGRGVGGGRLAARLGGEQVPGIGVLRIGEQSRTGPVSTISPLVMTQTRSAMLFDDAADRG
jgi:hypothetical protein